MKYKSLYVCVENPSWILGALANDIFDGFCELGYNCRKGPYKDYQGEDISIQMWWMDAIPHKDAKVNAIFITHTDDKYKEKVLVSLKDKFDIFLCMSPEDAMFLEELGFDKAKVFGINLPVRNTYVRPISIGIFSKCYPDKRKNEEWLFNYCQTNPNSRNAVFVFIGDGWGEFVGRLSEIDCSYEWINISPKMPYEYMYQQLKLSNIDYYIYMGMDGGAMGSYDAYAMGATLCITDDGFHKGIPDVDYQFVNEEGFHSQLNMILEKQSSKLDFFKENDRDHYVKKVAYVIENRSYQTGGDIKLNYSVKEKRRSYYFNRGLIYGIKRILKSFIK